MTGTLIVKVTEEKGVSAFEIRSRLQDVEVFDIALLLNTLASDFMDTVVKNSMFKLLSTGMLDRIDRTEIRMEAPE